MTQSRASESTAADRACRREACQLEHVLRKTANHITLTKMLVVAKPQRIRQRHAARWTAVHGGTHGRLEHAMGPDLWISRPMSGVVGTRETEALLGRSGISSVSLARSARIDHHWDRLCVPKPTRLSLSIFEAVGRRKPAIHFVGQITYPGERGSKYVPRL